jgi:hypothetical protein
MGADHDTNVAVVARIGGIPVIIVGDDDMATGFVPGFYLIVHQVLNWTRGRLDALTQEPREMAKFWIAIWGNPEVGNFQQMGHPAPGFASHLRQQPSPRRGGPGRKRKAHRTASGGECRTPGYGGSHPSAGSRNRNGGTTREGGFPGRLAGKEPAA